MKTRSQVKRKYTEMNIDEISDTDSEYDPKVDECISSDDESVDESVVDSITENIEMNKFENESNESCEQSKHVIKNEDSPYSHDKSTQYNQLEDNDEENTEDVKNEYDEEEYDEEEYDEEEYDEEEYDEEEYDEEEYDEEYIEEVKRKLKSELINAIKKSDIIFDSNCEQKITTNTSASPNHEKGLKKTLHSTLQKDELIYFNQLDKFEQENLSKVYEETLNQNLNTSIPMKFRILNSNMNPYVKSITLEKFSAISRMEKSSGEYNKHANYIQKLCKIPFGNHIKLPVSNTSSKEDIKQFLDTTSRILKEEVYGHAQAKDQIMRIVAQWISNPQSKGNVIGIHGNPGVGKTTLIKDGVCKALGLPFAFVPLGGSNDSSYLSGHSFTYEGSTCGKIVDLLIQANCMNPVIYFDELDKISDSSRGMEIINLLIHITDPSQNESFFDNYFSNVPIDLSKCLFIFTYNNDQMINPILKDRMITIHTKDYTHSEKIQIAKQFLLPNVKKSFNMHDVTIADETLDYVIQKTQKEAGVRNLKRSLERIVSNINIDRLNGDSESTCNIITKDHVDQYIKVSDGNQSFISHMYT